MTPLYTLVLQQLDPYDFDMPSAVPLLRPSSIAGHTESQDALDKIVHANHMEHGES